MNCLHWEYCEADGLFVAGFAIHGPEIWGCYDGAGGYLYLLDYGYCAFIEWSV